MSTKSLQSLVLVGKKASSSLNSFFQFSFTDLSAHEQGALGFNTDRADPPHQTAAHMRWSQGRGMSGNILFQVCDVSCTDS